MEQLGDIPQKYYSISEVASMFNVSITLIRYWETEFEVIRPKKNKRGYRQFTQQDLESFRLVHHLVKEKGYTIQGARETIRKNRGRAYEQMELAKKLEEVKAFLKELKSSID